MRDQEQFQMGRLKPPSHDGMQAAGTGSRPKYQYRLLTPGKNEIRLMKVLPAANSTDTIHCELLHTTLDEAPPYQALSYTWGDAAGARPICVDGMNLPVTQNLRHALHRLRPNVEPGLVLWVDAVCINQEDVSERGIQTGKMREIYRHAETVNVWLGLQNHDSGAAIELVDELNTCTPSEVGGIIQDPQRADQIKALVVLFRRQYYFRIWVVQEVQSARKAVVYCGPNVIPWIVLDKVCDILKREEIHLQKIFYKSPSFIRTLVSGGPRGLQLSRYSSTDLAPPLSELLLSHKSKKSTDPKDKVYALVGISSSRNSFGPIDYSLSVRDIYTHTARHIITTSQKLDIICVKQHDLDQFQLPSWAPDWTRPPPHPEHTVIGLHHSEEDFAAARETEAIFEFSDSGYQLKTKGIIIDTLKATSCAFKRTGSQSEAKPALKTLRQWWHIFSATKGDSLPSRAMFCQVISCGNWHTYDGDNYTNKLNAMFSLHNSLWSSEKNPIMSLLSNDEVTDTIVACSEEDYEKFQFATILSASLTMNRRRLFISSSGFVGLGPWNMEESDLVIVLYGCRFPVVLRPVENNYILIGEAYVHGFMTGEALDYLRDGLLHEETFEIH
ncbi:hypothetical protein BP5796_10570 [Coleophoma crateriformis]|uniref:Heterokaryon incompatibility domain-containing protein n=1 Tax=Coleophoma crateriformis TaxID=565419 RepID=A0A3D8QQX2_9HELO|nr:hypothetical protein BP5796_10570 [Coleophoma crateriformis]